MSGVLQLEYDLRRSRSSYRHGDITVYLSWNIPTRRPAMVLVPTQAVISRFRVVPCVVAMDTCWRWFPDGNGDPKFVALMSYEFAANLGLDPNNPKNCFKVVEVIHEHLQELLEMPELSIVSEGETQVVGEAVITERNTGQQVHQEIRDRV